MERVRPWIVAWLLVSWAGLWSVPLWAQPEIGVPFTYECVRWKFRYDPLPERAQRDVVSAIGSVVFAGVTAFLDLKRMLGLPFDPKLVVIGFFALGTVVSLTDYWFTQERLLQMEEEGRQLGCVQPERSGG